MVRGGGRPRIHRSLVGRVGRRRRVHSPRPRRGVDTDAPARHRDHPRLHARSAHARVAGRVAVPGRARALRRRDRLVVERDRRALERHRSRSRTNACATRSASCAPALRGEKVDEEYETFRVRGFRLLIKVAEQPPILVAALRPGMLRLAGREGDGAIINWLSADDVRTGRAARRRGQGDRRPPLRAADRGPRRRAHGRPPRDRAVPQRARLRRVPRMARTGRDAERHVGALEGRRARQGHRRDPRRADRRPDRLGRTRADPRARRSLRRRGRHHARARDPRPARPGPRHHAPSPPPTADALPRRRSLSPRANAGALSCGPLNVGHLPEACRPPPEPRRGSCRTLVIIGSFRRAQDPLLLGELRAEFRVAGSRRHRRVRARPLSSFLSSPRLRRRSGLGPCVAIFRASLGSLVSSDELRSVCPDVFSRRVAVVAVDPMPAVRRARPRLGGVSTTRTTDDRWLGVERSGSGGAERADDHCWRASTGVCCCGRSERARHSVCLARVI